MKSFSMITKKQSACIAYIKKEVSDYIFSIEKNDVETILLSGSVARGDYYPGKFGAKIDLTFMKKASSVITPEMILGPNLEPHIPYHCTKWGSEEFQIDFHDFIDLNAFQLQGEAKKSALLESVIIYDSNNRYLNELSSINKYTIVDQYNLKTKCISYIHYLLSGYKTNRWEQRDAFQQLHQNLNTSFNEWLKCAYYINNKYAPAEDRRLYYSYDLKLLPDNYISNVSSFLKQDNESELDYRRREHLFRNQFLSFIDRTNCK